MAPRIGNRQNPTADVKWPVVIRPSNGSIEGVTLNVSSSGVFIRCPKPLRLNEVFDMAIEVPGLQQPLQASGEVLWSNVYGPDDDITPRGMGARFVRISGADRKLISDAVMKHLNLAEIEPDTNTIEISTPNSL